MKKFLVITGVIVVVLGAAVVVGDRVAASYAEDEISKGVAKGLASRNITSAGPPEVTVTGIPFLTQVARGNYEEIQLNLRDLRGGVLPLPLLEVHAYDVKASLEELRAGTARPVATRMTGTGTLSYADLVAASGLTDVTLSGDGSLLILTGTVPLAGEVSGKARVSVVEDGKVRIEVAELGASNLTAAANRIVNEYRSLLNRTFTLPPLPFNLKLQAVRPTPAGVVVDFSATEVELA